MALQGEMVLRVWDVEHGACAMVQHVTGQYGGKLAMIDSGSTVDWRPSNYIRGDLGRTNLDYLFITNADQDHMSDRNHRSGDVSKSELYRRANATNQAPERATHC